MIKEIIDHFRDGEVTLKDIIEARSRKRDIEGAVTYLKEGKAKRRKLEEPQGDDAPSHQHAKSTHTGRTENFNNMHSDFTPSDAEASVDQTTGRKPKRSLMSKGREDVTADTYDSSSGSAVSKRKPSGGAPIEYKVSFGNAGGRCSYSINVQQLTEQDLYGVSHEGSQTNGITQHNVDARDITFPQAGPTYASKQLNWHTGDRTVSHGGSPSELTQRTVHERYTTFPQRGSLNEANQHYQDPRYGTFPQSGPSYHSDNTEQNHHYHRIPHSGRPSYTSGAEERIDSAMTNSHSVSPHETVPPLHPNSQYSGERSAGSDSRGHAVVIQSGTVLPPIKVSSDSNGYHSKGSSKTETRVYASSASDARYVNLHDISSSYGRRLGSSEPGKRVSTKESARLHDHKDAKYGPIGTSYSEPMEVEQTEYSRDCRNDATSVHNRMAEGAYASPRAQSGVTGLDATLSHQLSLEPRAHQAGKEAKQISKVPSEHMRERGSGSVARAQEATGSKGVMTGGAQPTRSLYQIEKITSQTAEKSEAEGSSWRTSAQREQAQNPAHSSKNERDTDASHKGKAPHTDVKRDDRAECDQCSLEGTIICIHCHRIVCRKCREIYVTDVCGGTKGEHSFTDLKDNNQKYTKSVDSRASSIQPHTNMNGGSVNEDQKWPCFRCTYLNSPDHKICAMCATTRGVGAVELTQAGSRVCRNCTYHNEENATVCSTCHKTLGLHPPETSV